jgi:GNAT superfamily N-acetyltransferase
MPINLEKAIESDAISIFDMQVNSFTPLLERYKDFNTSPATETIERTITRINNPSGGFYKIMLNHELVGAICVFWKEENQFWISPMFIHPKYQGRGIAQKSILIIVEFFPHATTWELATILEEKGNCYLYEKMGFTKTGIIKKVNASTTIVFYIKICDAYSSNITVRK